MPEILKKNQLTTILGRIPTEKQEIRGEEKKTLKKHIEIKQWFSENSYGQRDRNLDFWPYNCAADSF